MLPEAYIAHVSQGRMRIKIPSRKGDRTFFSALKDKLPESSEIPGIQRIEMNPTTGSVLVIYDPDYKMPDLTVVTSFLEQQGLFKLGATGNNSEPPVSRNIAKTFQGVNQKLTGFTSGEIDLQSLAVLGLLGLGLIQLSRGQVMIPAVSAFWYAATLLKDSSKKNGDQQPTSNN